MSLSIAVLYVSFDHYEVDGQPKYVTRVNVHLCSKNQFLHPVTVIFTCLAAWRSG